MPEEIPYPVRVNRYLALTGVTTRRAADLLIKEGLVFINGKTAATGQYVERGDRVEVKEDTNKPKKRFTYVLYYKPRGIVTHSPVMGERSIAESSNFPGLAPIGRLDKDSEGLMLLTDDGRVTERLLHPRFAHEKEYEVTVREKVPARAKVLFERGIKSARERLSAKRVSIRSPHTFSVVLTEGKTHQIRRMSDALHLTVEKLKRVRIMDMKLGSLKEGQGRTLEGKEKTDFLASLGLK